MNQKNHSQYFIVPNFSNFNLLTAEFSFKNPLQGAELKSSNDEYTRRTQGTCSYYKFYDKNKVERGMIAFSFNKKLSIHCRKRYCY